MNQKKSKAGLENQRDIPRAHIGFYTQCGKGLENQRCRQCMGNQRHAQAFTISAAQLHRAGEPAKDPKAHRGFYTQCGKGLENQRHHDMHRLLHSERHRAEEPEKIPRAHTGFYTQCGAGLENQRDILSAHTGFYAQCSTGKIYKKFP